VLVVPRRNLWIESPLIASIKNNDFEPFDSSYRPPFFSIDLALTRWVPCYC